MSRVLIVEDEPAYVDALEVALGQEGFAVESAVDGRAGLAAFRALEPDLVLLDLMLPVVSGLDVLAVSGSSRRFR
jgi:DNA-binding response OmpR family regulator